MKKLIACLLLGVLLGMITSLLPAQQNQNAQKSDSEIELLKTRISELKKQLQTVENVEKLDLQAKLAEANAKLANAEFGKFERELRDSNNEWLRNRVIILLAFLSVVGIGVWSWLKYRTNQLIEIEVEKNLSGFKEAVDAQDTIKIQLRELRKEHAASVLEDFMTLFLNEEQSHPEQIKALSEEDLLQVFKDERYQPKLRYQAAKVLTVRKSLRLVSPLLEFLNSVIDSELDIETEHHLRSYVNFFMNIYGPEAYQGLTNFLNRLLAKNPKHKALLTETVFVLVWIGFQLNMGDSVPILRRAIPHLKNLQTQQIPLGNLARYFDIFNEPAGIKEILINHVTSESSGMEEVEHRCLELLQRHDSEFVNEWRERETTDNSKA